MIHVSTRYISRLRKDELAYRPCERHISLELSLDLEEVSHVLDGTSVHMVVGWAWMVPR